MDTKAGLKSQQACLDYLKELGIDYVLHSHQAVFNMNEMAEAVKLQHNTVLVKNLFYVDKKGNYYLVLAAPQSQVGKQFWKTLGLSAGNMRMAKQEQLAEAIHSQKGAVNPFSLMNDTEDQVKKIIIDKTLLDYPYWGLHPVENTATVEVPTNTFLEKYLSLLKKEVEKMVIQDVKEEKKVEEQKELQQPEQQLAITVKRSENYSRWYQQVITKAEMIEYYDISGCYVLRPWSYCIWEQIQEFFNKLIRSDGVENAYFPMFVSEKALQKEKDHVEGFAPEVAWVTRYGTSELKEPIAIRPTSETIMYPAYAKWIQSHRDLPLKLNQWSNVVRWEFKFPTPFLRTREFLWQEGHTAHATEKEAEEQTLLILEFYRRIFEDLLAVPVIKGIKTEKEKFAGGKFTSTVETVIPFNGRGLQAATSHHLGQNFSKMFNIQFEDVNKQKQFVHQTSWGISTRSIGALIMAHGDDKGLVLPPKVAGLQVVIIGIPSKQVADKDLDERCQQIQSICLKQGFRCKYDNRENYNPGWKYNHWEQKGVPLRFEVGPKDYQNNEVRVVERLTNTKYQMKVQEIEQKLQNVLDDLQNRMITKAKEQQQNKIKTVLTWQDFMIELNKQNVMLSPWCKNMECEEQIKKRSANEAKEQDELLDGQVVLTGAAKSLCMPLEQPELKDDHVCFQCGQKAQTWCLWGRSY